jgi:hypothetical protein
MSREASAEREKRATITKAEGDRDAAINLAAAARTMSESPGAMQLRTLQTIDGLGPSAANTVVLAVPIDVMDTVRAVGAALGGDQRQPGQDQTASFPPSPDRALGAPAAEDGIRSDLGQAAPVRSAAG